MMVRLYIHADSENRPKFHLPWDYHLSFQSFIYSALGEYEPELATKLHQLKYAPPFSFSNFIQTGPYDTTKNGLSCTKGYWVFNSDSDAIINAVAQYAEKGGLVLGHTEVPVVSTTIEKVNNKDGEKLYKTTSPLAVGEFPFNGEGTREWYREDDIMWSNRIKESLENRMKHRLGVSREDIVFKIEGIEHSERKLRRVKNEIEIPCTNVKFYATTDSKTDRFIKVFGIGEKTGQGFGSIVSGKEIPQRWSQ